MMTEDDARKKWCPFVRYKSHQGEGINRWVDADDSNFNPDPSRCIASECMAWRSGGEMLDDQNGLPIGRPSGEGYCGLAGKP